MDYFIIKLSIYRLVKMQKKLNQFTYSIRKSVRNKLQNHSKIHTFLIFLHRKYCSLTGGLHVLPDFYIIGTQKGGTSSLYEYLLQHPSIEPCLSKEPSYFDQYYSRGLNWYKVCFPFKFHKFYNEKIKKIKFLTGEATVRYLDHPYTPQRIKQVTPNAKFIVMLRNPIYRALSQHTRVKAFGRDPLNFEEAIDAEDSRTKIELKKMLADENYFAENYFRYAYLKRGIYLDGLKNWAKVFPKEKLLIIQSEDFFKDPEKIYHQVLDFLELPPHILKIYRVVGRVNKNRKIEPKLLSKLTEYFRPHNEKLYDHLQRRFDWDEPKENKIK